MAIRASKLNQLIQMQRLQNKSFCIVSNDCWGAEVYRHFNFSYNTPFVGLYLIAPCYIELLKNLDHYMSLELKFVEESKYETVNTYKRKIAQNFPTGSIGSIEIQFLHYQNSSDAYEKWNRRKDRMNWNNLFVKFDASKDLATVDLAEKFDLLSFKNKLCLSDIRLENIKSNVYCPNWEIDGAKMFGKSIQYFSLINWLNTGGVTEPSLFDKVLQF